jgi:hypothetical protein
MTWESTGDFKTLDDIVAYGNARAEAERERIFQLMAQFEESLLDDLNVFTGAHEDAIRKCILVIKGLEN